MVCSKSRVCMYHWLAQVFTRSRAIRTEPISFWKCKQIVLSTCIPSLSDVTVNDVILTVPSDTSMKSGGKNEVSLDLAVLYAFDSEKTSVHGQGLWTTKLWVSRFADGSDELSGTVVEEALTEEQQSLSLRKNPATRTFSIDDIIYRFDLTNHTCKDAKYICAEFNKGQNPELERDYLWFHFQAKPTNGVLIDCIELRLIGCKRKYLYAQRMRIAHHYRSAIAFVKQSDLSTTFPLSIQLLRYTPFTHNIPPASSFVILTHPLSPTSHPSPILFTCLHQHMLHLPCSNSRQFCRTATPICKPVSARPNTTTNIMFLHQTDTPLSSQGHTLHPGQTGCSNATLLHYIDTQPLCQTNNNTEDL